MLAVFYRVFVNNSCVHVKHLLSNVSLKVNEMVILFKIVQYIVVVLVLHCTFMQEATEH